MFWGLLILFGVALLLLVAMGIAIAGHILVHPPRRTAGSALARGDPIDPSEAGYEYQTHRLRPEGRAPHEIEIWDVAGSNESGAVMIFVHGWSDSRRGALLWLDVLSGAACRVLIYDQRGHGESGYRRCSWGLRETEDARRIIDFAMRRWPDSPLVLFGCSMGAAIAIRAACTADESISGLVADSPYRRLDSAVANALRAYSAPSWLIAKPTVWLLRCLGFAPCERDFADVAASLRTPLLVMHGRDDHLISMDDARAIAHAACGQLIEFEACGHLQAACAHAAHYASQIERFALTAEEKRPGPQECGTEPFRGQ